MKQLKASLYHLVRPLVSVQRVPEYIQRIKQSDKAELTEKFLYNLLTFVRDNNAYYADVAKDASGLADLPILTKDIINKNFTQLKSEHVHTAQYTNSSGGSTGKPQTFVQDKEFSAWSEAAQEYYYQEFLHIKPETVNKVVLWGSERDTFKERDVKGQMANWLTNTVFLNTFRATEQDWLAYIDQINATKPYFVKGYAGSLYEIAKIALAHKKELWTPTFVYSSAETLQSYMRDTIEKAFGTKVYDYYGSREVGAIAGECQKGNKHIFTFHNVVEIVDEAGTPVKDGEPGRILITNLHNYSMPLIRYEIGDVGAMTHTPCACGSALPWFTELKGRITDHFVTKDGTLIHGEYFTHLFYFREWVDSFQVNQRDYTDVQILVVKKSAPKQSDCDNIEQKIKYVLGEKTKIDWEFVDSIPKTPQGKHLFTRCLIKRSAA